MPSILSRIGVGILLVTIALPLHAQEVNTPERAPREWAYCPTAPEERVRQCRQAGLTLSRTQDRVDRVGAQMQDPGTMLVRVEREPGEPLDRYQTRVKQHQGVATPASNQWIAVRGRYFDPDRQVMLVALDRKAYWRYVWETLTPDEELARRTFRDRERSSHQFKQRFTGPGGKLDHWRRDIAEARRFQEACCEALPYAAPEGEERTGLPGMSDRPRSGPLPRP